MISQRGWAIILFFNIAFIVSRTYLCEFGKTKHHDYIGKNYPVKLPVTVNPVQATFDCSVRYALNSSVAAEVWSKATDTRNGGFVRLGPDRRVFAVSMFHELHCISALSTALNETVQTPELDAHMAHCLGYLRMFTLCSADATEEPIVKVSTLKSQGCAPSFTRRCRDWNLLYDFLSTNYLSFHEFKTFNGTWNFE